MIDRAHDPYRPRIVPTLTDIVQAQPANRGGDASHQAQSPADAGLRPAAPVDIPDGMPVPLAQIPTLMPEPQPAVALRSSRCIERALTAVGGAASSDAAPPSQSLQPASSAVPDASAWQGAFDDLQPLSPPAANALHGLQDGAGSYGDAALGQPMPVPSPRDAASELAERVAWEMLQLGQAASMQSAQPELQLPAVAVSLDEVEPLPMATDGVQAEGFCAVAARAAQADAWPDAVALRGLLPADLEEQLVHRVMQRIGAVLTDRVGEVVSVVIERQTRSLLPSIREELEFAIRKSVYEAMADELAGIQANGLEGAPQ